MGSIVRRGVLKVQKSGNSSLLLLWIRKANNLKRKIGFESSGDARPSTSIQAGPNSRFENYKERY